VQNTQPIKSFRDLARAIHAEDVRKADNLRKASSLPKPKVGPKVAR
jgi:hypothetical protein